MNKRYNIAYGSNLNLEQMRLRCAGAELIGTARLEGWRLLYKGEWNNSYLTIEREEGYYVPIAVWRISRRDEMLLDRYEGYPALYYKKEFLLAQVICSDGTLLKNISAFAYIMNVGNEPQVPSMEYVDECIEGYRNFDFDPGLLLEALEETRRRVDES